MLSFVKIAMPRKLPKNQDDIDHEIRIDNFIGYVAVFRAALL
jgi:hypothetical protein